MSDAVFVNRVRLHVLEVAGRTGVVPAAAEVAGDLGQPETVVAEAFRELGDAHVYVVEPGDPSRLRMANPYSAVPTPFRVDAAGGRYFGNCAWDGLGIISLLGGEGRLVNDCPDCGEAQELLVEGRRLVSGPGIVHFGVPARRWWDDIIHT